MKCFWCGEKGATRNGRQVRMIRERREAMGREWSVHGFHSWCAIIWEDYLNKPYAKFAAARSTSRNRYPVWTNQVAVA